METGTTAAVDSIAAAGPIVAGSTAAGQDTVFDTIGTDPDPAAIARLKQYYNWSSMVVRRLPSPHN